MPRLWLLAMACSLPAFGADANAIDDAFNRLYNFDFQGAQEILNHQIADHPQDPLPYSVRASAYLFFELDRLGILESEFLVSDKHLAEKKKLQPDPGIRDRLLAALQDTQRRGEAALAANPNDRSALLAMCIAQGVTTDYMALIEKRQLSSLTPAKRANSYAQRLLKLDPEFYDAYLAAGFSEYMLGSLPFFVRWFVRFDNVSGDKQSGMDHLALVARAGHYLKPFAKILLGIINLREKRPQEAQRLLVDLANSYPENPLFRKELSKINTQLGN